MIALLLFLAKSVHVLKAIIYPFLALLLMFSILAPSIMPLLDNKYEIAVPQDLNEEEKKQENEPEKNFDYKNSVLINSIAAKTRVYTKKILYHSSYLFTVSIFDAEIPFPPPRKFVQSSNFFTFIC